MTTKYSTLLLYTILLGAPLARAPICNADEFHSDSYGYRIEPPQHWIEIPKEQLHEAVALILKQNSAARIFYDTGFQLDSTDEWFEFPYVLVQPIPYADHGIRRQLNEDEFAKFVRSLTGENVGKFLDKDLSSLGRQVITNVDARQPQLDVANRRYLWTMNTSVQGVGPVRCLLVGYFGRDSIVQVMFFSHRADWDRYADLRATIVDSFRFDPDKAYSVQVAALNPTPPSTASRAIEKGLAGLIAGGLIALIVGCVVAVKRKITGVSTASTDGVPTEGLSSTPADVVSTKGLSSTPCKGCGRPLRIVQVESMLGNSAYEPWCREGYCSLPCYRAAMGQKHD